MAFIVDRYNKYDQWDQEHSKYIFQINGWEYAIKEVILCWGQPQLPVRIGREQNPEAYFIYGSYEDAMEFVQRVKSLN